MNSSRFGGITGLLSELTVKLRNLKVKKGLSVFLVITVIFGVFFVYQYKKMQYEISTRAYDILVENKSIGAIRDKQKVLDIVNNLQNELSKEYDIKATLNTNISFKETHVEDDELISEEQLERYLKTHIDFNVVAYSIVVNGKELGILKSKEMADKVLEDIKKPYIDNVKEGTNIEEVKIVEDVQIVEKEVPYSKIQDYETVLSILQKGTDEKKVHVVKEGENFWTIAKKYNITVDDLVKANPDKDTELIHPGDELSLVVPKPYITVATYEKETYIQEIAYDTKVMYDSSIYEDESKIKKKGVPGESKVVAKIEKHNGIEVAREIIEETIISHPVAQVIIKGSKELPPLKGTGSFANPLIGQITSRFGMRWGRMHEGIDIAARTGTPIRAADGGVVTYAGWKGNYGYLVEIDHGGGFKTRYGHCSKIYVKVGQKVYKGKVIAAVGNTGRSTGPHLHFEVLKYGTPQNPSKYIGKKYR